MRDKVLKLILVLSLLMNVSFIGGAAYTHYKQVHFAGPPFGGPGSGPPGMVGPGMFFEALSLRPEQVKLFQEKASSFHGALIQKREEVDRLRVSLLRLMHEDHPDSSTIEQTIAWINKVQEDMQRMVVSHMLEFKSMLDKEQQKKFLDLIEKGMGQRKDAVCP